MMIEGRIPSRMVFYPLCSNGCLFSAYIAVISFLPEADP